MFIDFLYTDHNEKSYFKNQKFHLQFVSDKKITQNHCTKELKCLYKGSPIKLLQEIKEDKSKRKYMPGS